jgi:hypothetical protein
LVLSLRARLALVAALAVTVSASAAGADAEVWAGYEHRIPLWRRDPVEPLRLNLRVAAEARFNIRSAGLDMLFLRAGPILHPTSWLALATHATVAPDKQPDGSFVAQIRAELDVAPHASFGDFTLLCRVRSELIWTTQPAPIFRSRHLVRVNWRALPWLMPFAANELFFGPTLAPVVSENRAQAGLGFVLGSKQRIDVSYVWRLRAVAADVAHDHMLVALVFFGIPAAAAHDADAATSGK